MGDLTVKFKDAFYQVALLVAEGIYHATSYKIVMKLFQLLQRRVECELLAHSIFHSLIPCGFLNRSRGRLTYS